MPAQWPDSVLSPSALSANSRVLTTVLAPWEPLDRRRTQLTFPSVAPSHADRDGIGDGDGGGDGDGHGRIEAISVGRAIASIFLRRAITWGGM